MKESKIQPPVQEGWLKSMKEKMENLLAEKEINCKTTTEYKNKVRQRIFQHSMITYVIFRLRPCRY